MNHVTVQDIADKLNLSRNTVSKVLNGKSGVLPQTQELILQTARDMGYYKFKPSVARQAEPQQAENNDHKIILLLTTKGGFNLFWSSMAGGVYEELANHSYSFIYGEASVDKDGNAELPAVLSQNIIGGIVVINVYEPVLINTIAKLDLPCVYYDIVVGRDPVDVNGDIIISDGIYTVREMTKHMIHNGAKKLCFVGDISAGMSIYDRWLGFMTAHNETGTPINQDLCLTKDDSFYLKKKNLESAIGALPFIPDGFVCASDHIAHTIIQYYKGKGYSLPSDIKICGYDDVATSVIVRPYLTSAKVSNSQLGKRIAQQLLLRINAREKPFELVRIYPKIWFRESSDYTI